MEDITEIIKQTVDELTNAVLSVSESDAPLQDTIAAPLQDPVETLQDPVETLQDTVVTLQDTINHDTQEMTHNLINRWQTISCYKAS